MTQRFRFEKLAVWQEARVLAREVYRLTRAFPKAELFGLVSQLRRAAVSVAANIAEGSGRNSDRDFAHFLEMAYGSLMEVAALLMIASDEGCSDEVQIGLLLDRVEPLARQIAALNRSLSVDGSKTPFGRKAPQMDIDPRPSALD